MDAYTFIYTITKEIPGVKIEKKGSGKMLINGRFFLENKPGSLEVDFSIVDDNGNYIETKHNMPVWVSIQIIQLYAEPRNTKKVPGMGTTGGN